MLWLVFDFIGVITGGDNIGHWAHIGGFFSGVGLGFLLLRFQKVTSFDSSIVDLWNKRKRSKNFTVDDASQWKPEHLRNQMSGEDLDKLDRILGSAHGTVITDPNNKTSPQNDLQEPTPQKKENDTEVIENAESNLSPTVPLPRLLRAHRSQKDISIFFVNEGDEVKNFSISSPQGFAVEFSPKGTLKKNEPGWAILRSNDGGISRNPSILLSYFSNGELCSKEYYLDEENNKMVE